MARIKLDKPSVIKALQDAVAERGTDYYYPREERGDKCVYVHDGKPDCLVAVALHDLGVTVEELERYGDDKYAENGTVVGAELLVNNLVEQGIVQLVEVGAKYALGAAQSLQDTGHSWGEALDHVVAGSSTVI